MSKRFEFFYDFESPFAFLASTQVEALAQRTGAELLWRPIFLAGVMQAVDNRPPAQVVPKGKYLWRELVAWREIYNVRLKWPKRFPIGAHLRPIRGALFAFSKSLEAGVAYTHAVFDAHWSQHVDITEDDVMRACCEKAGLDLAELDEAVKDPMLKQRLKDSTQELIDRGGFGVPTFYVDGEEMFWGLDKMGWVEARLADKPLGPLRV
ncbi:MAG: 2-hydroxychromene-2-carboxylate isomerase [Myxococcales bacterium]|nr:2-hydroxychromene-2-carboxylate isomerase [Myxococcales bacterium]